MFGEDFFKNALLIFTRFEQSSRSIQKRERGESMTEDQIIKEFRDQFERIYSFRPQASQFCFIDNHVLEDPLAE
jgi:hypothetical protein